ncbi:hypothetical protein [Gynurincola endophyticus]|uniref:hypothetical protein n=1 Tax=Gynurincola endophyticus TaxID=2479004 RepID=UPI000F8CD7F3|nr:hypothetical protein [Gynurincola endophyticus]
MSLHTAIKLVHSLSKSEKKMFTLYTRQQSVTRGYVELFRLIERHRITDVQNVSRLFLEKYNRKQLNNSAAYLVKVITQCLIDIKTEKDPFFQLIHKFLEVQILQERALYTESNDLRIQIQLQARLQQQPVIEYLTYRKELDVLSINNFQEINDTELIQKQMRAKELLKTIHHAQEHHTLFELLKYRLTKAGKLSSAEEQKKMNDLMLSEMILVADKSKKNFTQQKLHLLFQSYFFTNVSDHRSALKTFNVLNQLFEDNIALQENPPHDYLSTLTGILDNLQSLKMYTEMEPYLLKLQQLSIAAYPEYFKSLAHGLYLNYQLAIFIANNELNTAKRLIEHADNAGLHQYVMADEEKLWSLFFYCSLTYFKLKEYKKAHRFISHIMNNYKEQTAWIICKATRLLNMMIYFEQGDNDYLEYEIRSYKRFYKNKKSQLKSELMLLRLLANWSKINRKNITTDAVKKLNAEIKEIQSSPYEEQLLVYIDIPAWAIQKTGIMVS